MATKTILIVTLCVVVSLGLAVMVTNGPSLRADEIKQAGPPVAQDTLLLEKLVIETKKGKRHDFDVEIARTPSEQNYGLMNRTSMPKDHGMLFEFVTEDERSFWMKNTLIPLDIIFIRADGTIHSIHESAIPNDLTEIRSNGPALAALELNGGRTADLGIKPGDKVFYKLFQPPQ